MHYCFFTRIYSRYDVLMYQRQGKSLSASGIKVTYVVSDGKPSEIVDGITIISYSNNPNNRFQRICFNKEKFTCFLLSIDADIYQTSDPELITLVDILKSHNKKVVFHLREFYPTMILRKTYIPFFLRKFVASYYEKMMRYYFTKYDVIFVVTDWICKLFQDNWGLKNVRVLTNFPIVNEKFNLTYEEYLQRGNVLGYEGTVYVHSRQENVFDVLSEMPNVSYYIAGRIYPNNRKIMKHPYWNKVKFQNGFKYSELEEIFAKMSIANVFRDFCGQDGSLGVLKVFESMGAALPVLLADVPLYRKINEKWHCGICVDPNDKKSIKNAIEYLVNNKKVAYQMGQNGRKAVLTEYNWESQFVNYFKIINNL